MSKKFKVWLDSGANIHSMFSVVVSLEELGYTYQKIPKKILCGKSHLNEQIGVGRRLNNVK